MTTPGISALTRLFAKWKPWLLVCLITIPVAVSGFIAFNTLQNELLKHERDHLYWAGKVLLLSAYSELQAQEMKMKRLLSLSTDIGQEELVKVLDRSFDNYLVVSPTQIFSKGLDQDEVETLIESNRRERSYRSKIILSPSFENKRVWISSQYNQDVFAATAMEPFAFENARRHLPEHAEWCIIEESGARVYCPYDFADESIASTIEKSRHSLTGDIAWTEKGEDFIGSYWTLSLGSGFAAPNWIILTRVTSDYVLSPLTDLGRHFLPPVGIIIFCTLLILLLPLRRRMAPLQSLLEGTRRIGKKDFSTRIHLEGEDEFAELARSFNLMSSQLDRQFLSIEVSAQIDETILSTFDMRRVVNLLLERVFDIFDCAFSSILLMDQWGTAGQIHYCTKGNDPNHIDVVAGLDLQSMEYLEWFEPQDCEPDILESIYRCAGRRFSGVRVPICVDGSLVGLFVLDIDKEEQDLEVTEEVLSDFAQRLAVARSADEWEARLKYQAQHDALTRLPNRLSFQNHLKNQIASADSLSVLFVDLDHFKNVNDTKGHSTGDQLLCLAAKRLQKAAGSYGRVFRLGGDEFTVVADDIDQDETQVLVDRILEQLRAPFTIDSREFFVTASIGVSRYPENGSTMETLLKNADLAMYFAKQNGRNKFKFFNSSMMSSTYCRSVLETDLRKAIKEEQFFLVYQPQVNIKSQEVVCLEALIRWQHPEHGKILPDVFIPLAEEIGLIEVIDEWVVAAVFEQYASWNSEGIAIDKIAVNVSPTSLRSESYLTHLKELMLKHNTRDFLELEITENVFVEDTQQILQILNQIKALSIDIALDDFGTGYSSLSYLHKFPIDALKIDMSFIKEVSQEKDTDSIVQAIIKVAKSLNLSVVAEGVESEEQLMFLDREGCELAQGFYYSEPLHGDVVGAYINGFRFELLRQLSG